MTRRMIARARAGADTGGLRPTNPVRHAPSGEAEPWRALVRRHGSPLLVLDRARLRRRYRALARALPGVELYYAIKSLPHPEVIRTLLEEGAGLDIASAGEIALVREAGVGTIAGRPAIHTHPVKTDAEIRAALRFGCTTFVADNALELQKLVRYRNRVRVLVRVGFRAPDAAVDLSRKFGCAPGEAAALIDHARCLGLAVKGLSFHVGSQCREGSTHALAIRASAAIMAQAETDGPPMSVLDIGGGFPARYEPGEEGGAQHLERFCAPIREALATLPEHIRVIAEPGRVLSAPAVTHVGTVIGKAERDGRLWLYLDDGVYGAFSGQIYDGMRYPLTLFGQEGLIPGVLAGPTCDSIDVIAEDILVPDPGLGEIVVTEQMGAYTAASATDFNSLPRARFVVLDEDEEPGSAPMPLAG